MLHQPANTVTGKREYTLVQNYVYELPAWFVKEAGLVAKNGEKPNLVIPIGTKNNGANIPLSVQPLLMLTADFLMRGPSLVHDEPYKLQGRISVGPFMKQCYLIGVEVNEIPFVDISRKLWDKLFRHMMIEAGISKVQANLAYLGVRWFAKTRW